MPVKHVFVVMLENRSFDHLLGLSGFQPDISSFSNTYVYNQQQGKAQVSTPAPANMTTDPGHELLDVLQQVTNKPTASFPNPLHAYPRNEIVSDFPNNSGFAQNYIDNNDEDNTAPPTIDHVDDIMKVFSPEQLPVYNALAKEFAVCTRWHSSIPGPTWPNRFFLHLGASSGLDATPTTWQIIKWITEGFPCPNGHIFKSLKNAGHRYRLYQDMIDWDNQNSAFSDDPEAGDGVMGLGYIPQSAVLPGIELWDFWELKKHFKKDLEGDYPYEYTFIEPHYGNLRQNIYKGGSSQHAMDDIYGGEALIKFVYETLRNSPLWEDSLLIITYDEHGGFYDHVPPPEAVRPDNIVNDYGINRFGFEFDQYGIRVPTVIVSPYIAKGVIDDNPYDHTSVLATLEKLYELKPLTKRDAEARDVLGLLSLSSARTDCPATLPEVPPSTLEKQTALSAAESAAIDAGALPESGNMIGALAILMKAESAYHKLNLETAEADTADKMQSLRTLGDVGAYADEVMEKVRSIVSLQRGE